MEEFITTLVVAGLFYAALRFFKISWFKQSFPPSFIYLAGVFAWCTALALVACVYSFVSMVIEVISVSDSDLLIPCIIILVVLGVAAKLLFDRKQVLDVRHMTPFLRSAILFQPYDARRQEILERNERLQVADAKKVAAEREASGQPAEVIDISEGSGADQGSAFAAAESSSSSSELDLLARGEGADISELFTTNTAKVPGHPLYQFISLVRISPTDKVMSFKMVLPASATEPDLTPEKLQRVKQGIYQVFQTLIVESWLKPYLPFFNSVRTTCFRVHKDEFDMTRESPFISVQIDVARLRQSRGKQFNSSEFEKIATITPEG